MKNNKAIVLAIDGVDGSGKSTLIQYLKHRLENLHKEPMMQLPRPVRVYAEHVFKSSPQGLHFYNLMESGQLDKESIAMGSLYHSSLHLKHIRDNIVNNYDVVLIDRFRPSFLAYQIHADNLNCFQDVFETVLENERQKETTPDYLYLRSSLQRSKKMLRKRKDQDSYHDKKNDSFKEKLLQGYDEFFYSTRYNFAKNTIRVDLDQFDKENTGGVAIFLEKMFQLFLYHYPEITKMVREKHWNDIKPTRAPGILSDLKEDFIYAA